MKLLAIIKYFIAVGNFWVALKQSLNGVVNEDTFMVQAIAILYSSWTTFFTTILSQILMIWKECIFSLERKPLTNDGRGFVFIWRLARYSTCLYILYLNSRCSLKIKAYFMPTLHLAMMLKYLVLQNISCWSDIFMPISCLIRSYLHFNRDKCRGENIWGLWKEEWRVTDEDNSAVGG